MNYWTSYLNFNGSYATSKSSNLDILAQKGYSFYYSSNNSFVLNKKQELNFLANFWHQLPSRSDNLKSYGIASLSLGLRFPVLKKKVQVSLIASDVFKGATSKGELFFSEFTQYYNNYYDNRQFSFSLTYNFGNNKVKGNNKHINFKEKYRGN